MIDEWGVEKSVILPTAHRFFNDYKKFGTRIKKLDQTLLEYQVKYLLADKNISVGYHHTDHEKATVYFSFLSNFAEELVNSKKGVIYFTKDFIFGLLGDKNLLPEVELKKFLDSVKKNEMELKYDTKSTVTMQNKKKVNVFQFVVFHSFNPNTLVDYFNSLKFTKI